MVRIIAWCRQSTSHYLSHCWPRLCRHMALLDHNEFINCMSVNFGKWMFSSSWTFIAVAERYLMSSARVAPGHTKMRSLSRYCKQNQHSYSTERLIALCPYLSKHFYTRINKYPDINTHIFTSLTPFNTLRPRQNGRHFADDIFKLIFLNENV